MELFEVMYEKDGVGRSEYMSAKGPAVKRADDLEKDGAHPTVYRCDIAYTTPVGSLFALLNGAIAPRRIGLVYGQLPMPGVRQIDAGARVPPNGG